MSRTIDLLPDCPGLCSVCHGYGTVFTSGIQWWDGRGWARIERCPACLGERVPLQKDSAALTVSVSTRCASTGSDTLVQTLSAPRGTP